MFRDLKNPKEVITFLVSIANEYELEGKKSSLIAAYRILSTIYESYPDRYILGRIGVLKVKLKDLGVLELAMESDVGRPEMTYRSKL